MWARRCRPRPAVEQIRFKVPKLIPKVAVTIVDNLCLFFMGITWKRKEEKLDTKVLPFFLCGSISGAGICLFTYKISLTFSLDRLYSYITGSPVKNMGTISLHGIYNKQVFDKTIQMMFLSWHSIIFVTSRCLVLVNLPNYD